MEIFSYSFCEGNSYLYHFKSQHHYSIGTSSLFGSERIYFHQGGCSTNNQQSDVKAAYCSNIKLETRRKNPSHKKLYIVIKNCVMNFKFMY